MTQPECVRCRRPAGDQTAYLCQPCGQHYAAQLGDVRALIDALLTSYTRQGRIGDGNGGRRGNDTPLPYDPRARDASQALHNALGTTARMVAEERDPVTVDGPTHWRCTHPSCVAIRDSHGPEDTSPAIAAWLLTHVDWLRHHQAGHEMLDEITDALFAIRRVVDLPAERWYAGDCGEEITAIDRDPQGPASSGTLVLDRDGKVITYECMGELYATARAVTVTCPDCDGVFDVAARREWLLEMAEDELAPLRVLASLLSEPDRALHDGVVVPGRKVTTDQLKGYRRRGRIVAHGLDLDGVETFRVGEVRAVLVDSWQREAEREAKRRLRNAS